MFSHVMVGVNNLEVSRKFYDALLGTLGIGPGVANKERYFYRSPTGTFGITKPINGQPATCLLYTSPSPRDRTRSRMPSSA